MDARPPVIDEATALLDDVDAALVRLSEGSYRTCEACGERLAPELLAAHPTRRVCGAH